MDKDGDGYDDGPEDPPAPDAPPNPDAPSNPDAPPNPEVPADPNQPPVPIILTVNIVGAFGSGAFAPNPLQVALGNTIVWTNSDLLPHVIVLDDGTPVGTLAPGQSSLPVAIAAETMGYHCLLHPSMVGQITTVVPGETIPPDGVLPPDGAQPPADPVPPATPPAPEDPDDGYKDDYYLRLR